MRKTAFFNWEYRLKYLGCKNDISCIRPVDFVITSDTLIILAINFYLEYRETYLICWQKALIQRINVQDVFQKLFKLADSIFVLLNHKSLVNVMSSSTLKLDPRRTFLYYIL